ncbi:HAMP domain-containing sensor histidine kinase [Sphingomonas sp. NFR15]|uniref:sensor histidine kinase n=1 Tax=Sphingomonas sp. NFR15 TaxID=1566282 RepID=UPI0015A49165|nr:HAMP domain-containing sensor histidine kinase [Sphingomonas sp. NFR15]
MALGHSLGNPLTALSAQVKSLSRNLLDDDTDLEKARLTIERISSILEAATTRVSAVTHEFQAKTSAQNRHDLNEIVQLVRAPFEKQSHCSRLRIQLDLAVGLPAIALDHDHDQIARVVTEMMLNASEAMYSRPSSDGLLTVRTSLAQGSIRLDVVDSGGGAPDPERIFAMHHTTKSGRSGTGLSVARALVMSNGGQLAASNNDRGGLTIALHLPIED